MLFKRKFFLDLDAEAGQAAAPAAVVAPPRQEAAAPAQQPAVTSAPTPAAAAAPAASAAAAAAPQAPQLTTAEAIAAELAAEQANRPAPTQATFAPDCLNPGAAQLRRRRAGADLGRFRAMAGSMLRS